MDLEDLRPRLAICRRVEERPGKGNSAWTSTEPALAKTVLRGPPQSQGTAPPHLPSLPSQCQPRKVRVLLPPLLPSVTQAWSNDSNSEDPEIPAPGVKPQDLMPGDSRDACDLPAGEPASASQHGSPWPSRATETKATPIPCPSRREAARDDEPCAGGRETAERPCWGSQRAAAQGEGRPFLLLT